MSEHREHREKAVEARLCACGHPAKWHGELPGVRGGGSCEHDRDCQCKRFLPKEAMDAAEGVRDAAYLQWADGEVSDDVEQDGWLLYAIQAAEPHLQRMYFERLGRRGGDLPPALSNFKHGQYRDLILAALVVAEEDAVKLFREAVLSDEAVIAGARRRHAIKRSENRGLPLYDGLSEMQQACLRGTVRSDIQAALDKAQELMEGESGG